MEIFREWFIGHIGSKPVIHGLIGGMVITLLNTFGALAVLCVKRVSDKFLDASLGFSAGVMLVASFTSLILPGIKSGDVILGCHSRLNRRFPVPPEISCAGALHSSSTSRTTCSKSALA